MEFLLTYVKRNRERCAIADATIEKMAYLEEEQGIAVWLIRPLEMNIQERSCQQRGYDLFLPYFSERSFREMIEFRDLLESDHAF